MISGIKPGDIIFASKKGPMSWTIRKLDRFKFSHVCLVADKDHVYTTGFGGKGPKTLGFLPASQLRKLEITEYLANKTYEGRRYEGLTDEQRQKIIAWCEARLGQKYPFLKTIVLLSDLLRHKNTTIINVQPNQQHCWELVAEAYKSAGIEINPAANNKDASGYDAKEIYESPELKPL